MRSQVSCLVFVYGTNFGPKKPRQVPRYCFSSIAQGGNETDEFVGTLTSLNSRPDHRVVANLHQAVVTSDVVGMRVAIRVGLRKHCANGTELT